MKSILSFAAAGLFLAAHGTGVGQPIITNQPGIQSAAPGATVTFRVGATGIEPLAYQWQRNLGAGYSDLAEHTNAVLTVTNVQPWDAAYYRVLVTNSSGARASTGAYLYVMSTAMRTNREVIDDFDDGILTGWNNWSSNGQGKLNETNGQFTVRGYWPGAPQSIWDRWAKGWKNFRPRTLAEGQRLERRVDLIKMSEDTTLVNIGITGDNISHGYVLTYGRGWVAILKWMGHFAFLALYPANLPDKNVVLSLALERVQGNLLITARILEKSEKETVLFEKSVWDTPAVDPTISSNQVYTLTGLMGTWVADVNGSPWFKFDYLDLEIVNFKNVPNPAAEVKGTTANSGLTACLPCATWIWLVPTPRHLTLTGPRLPPTFRMRWMSLWQAMKL